nr:hypothetical protein [Mammaliicoccus sp. Marseille-Q6498]
MNTLLICMVGVAFLTAMLTAGRDSKDYGLKEEALNEELESVKNHK